MNIRPVTKDDLEAVGQIAYATGFFGQSAAHYFKDANLFRDIWVRSYIHGPGCCNYLAEQEGKVVGYIVGTCNQQAHVRYLAFNLFPFVLRRWARGEYPYWASSFLHLLRVFRYSRKAAPAQRYPAHLHLNLLPEVRGLGLGRELLQAYLACLKARRLPGVQLSTTRENQAAVALYQKLGFKIFAEYESPLWRPLLGRNVLHLVMVHDLG